MTGTPPDNFALVAPDRMCRFANFVTIATIWESVVSNVYDKPAAVAIPIWPGNPWYDGFFAILLAD
jgi:hypothetical protein